jgi:hypothetical protein
MWTENKPRKINYEVSQALIRHLAKTGQAKTLARLAQASKEMKTESANNFQELRMQKVQERYIQRSLASSTTNFWTDGLNMSMFTIGNDLRTRMPHVTIAYALLLTFRNRSPYLVLDHDHDLFLTRPWRLGQWLAKTFKKQKAINGTNKVEKTNTHLRHDYYVNNKDIWKTLFPGEALSMETTPYNYIMKKIAGTRPALEAFAIDGKVEHLSDDLNNIFKVVSATREWGAPTVVQQGCIMYISSLILAWRLLALLSRIVVKSDRMELSSNLLQMSEEASQAYDALMEMCDNVSQYCAHDAKYYLGALTPIFNN